MRWSPDGNLLASGSDDKCVLVYYLNSSEATKTFGSHSSTPNKENWSACYTLRGHTMEVLDISFSPREILASASIDNTILLWNMASPSVSMFPFKILHEHTSFVKGLAFDPIGVLNF